MKVIPSMCAIAIVTAAALIGCTHSRCASCGDTPDPDPNSDKILEYSFTDLESFDTDLTGAKSWTVQFDIPDGLTENDISIVLVGINTSQLSFNSELCNINGVKEHCMDSLRWDDAGVQWEIFDRTNNTYTVTTTTAWDRNDKTERKGFSKDREKRAVLDGKALLRVKPSTNDSYQVHEILVRIVLL